MPSAAPLASHDAIIDLSNGGLRSVEVAEVAEISTLGGRRCF
jgi:hypothetical protein